MGVSSTSAVVAKVLIATPIVVVHLLELDNAAGSLWESRSNQQSMR